jgi:hypothetical protein
VTALEEGQDIFEPTPSEVAWLYGENGRRPDSWKPRSLADVSDEPPEPPTLGGLNLVYHGKRHLFSGPQESAKTLAAYVVGLSVVREGGRVMLIDFEMGDRDAKRRLRELGATDDDLTMFDYIEPEVPLTEPKTKELVALAPSLVIIDASAGAYDLQGLDDNKRQDVERFASLYVNPFWRAKIATLTIDHVVKNVEARSNYAIGSERKAGGTDVHLGFTVLSPIKRGTSGKYQITTHKDRGGFHKRGKLATFELTSDPETHHFTWAFVAAPVADEEHPFRPTGLMERVSRFLERQPEPVSRNVVEEERFGKRDYVRSALDLLTDEGYVEETAGPRSARLVALIRAYREASDDFAPTSPHFAPKSEESTSPLRPTPYGGGEVRGDLAERGEVTSPSLLEDNDGIPF